MNIKKKQEAEELVDIENFLQTMEIQPEHTEVNEKDPPDFYIVRKSNRIAIEVTNYHSMRKGAKGNAWRAVEEEWMQISDLLIKEKEQYPNLNDVYGHLDFGESEMPPTKVHGAFVAELLEFGISQCETLTEERSVFDSFPSNYALLNKYLTEIMLQQVCGCTMWSRNVAAYLGITEEELEKCVSKKLKKPRPQKITENWLLIVSGTATSQQIGKRPCGKFNSFAEVNKRLEESHFDKVFFFQNVQRCVLCWSLGKQWEEVKPAKTR